MKKVTLTLNEETSRFEAKDRDGVVHYTAAKLSDLKTSLKRSKKEEYEIVETFDVTIEIPSGAIEKANEKKILTNKKKISSYEKYKTFILTNFKSEDLYSKSPKIADFCKNFDLTLSKAGRNITFEKTLTKMIDDGIVEHAVEIIPTGKYQKLTFRYTSAHNSIMSSDDEEL
jgi:hypothetical protein